MTVRWTDNDYIMIPVLMESASTIGTCFAVMLRLFTLHLQIVLMSHNYHSCWRCYLLIDLSLCAVIDMYREAESCTN